MIPFWREYPHEKGLDFSVYSHDFCGLCGRRLKDDRKVGPIQCHRDGTVKMGDEEWFLVEPGEWPAGVDVSAYQYPKEYFELFFGSECAGKIRRALKTRTAIEPPK